MGQSDRYSLWDHFVRYSLWDHFVVRPLLYVKAHSFFVVFQKLFSFVMITANKSLY